MKPSGSRILRALLSASAILCGYAVQAAAPTPVESLNEIAALNELKLLLRLPDWPTIDALSRSLDFRYRHGPCRDSKSAIHLCSFHIDTQQSEVGRILVLELGQATSSRAATGRVIWVPWDKTICLRPARLAELLGNGQVTQLSTALFVPGGNRNAKARRTIEYASIPGAAGRTVATASFHGDCLLELTVAF